MYAITTTTSRNHQTYEGVLSMKNDPRGPGFAPVKTRATTLSVYLHGQDLDHLDALAATLEGSRSDAIRYLLSLDETKPKARTAKETR